MITANQPFSGWEAILPDKAMTIAAIDRLVHHCTILEMNVESYRRRQANVVATPLNNIEIHPQSNDKEPQSQNTDQNTQS